MSTSNSNILKSWLSKSANNSSLSNSANLSKKVTFIEDHKEFSSRSGKIKQSFRFCFFIFLFKIIFYFKTKIDSEDQTSGIEGKYF
jgi:hypothetical protein